MIRRTWRTTNVINDRFTAKVLGLLCIVFTVLIDASFFMFSRPEAKAKPGFALIVIVPSLPFVAIGAWLLRRAERMNDAD
jgi:lipopolysaccharide export LptBFGC system permease protein LptF